MSSNSSPRHITTSVTMMWRAHTFAMQLKLIHNWAAQGRLCGPSEWLQKMRQERVDSKGVTNTRTFIPTKSRQLKRLSLGFVPVIGNRYSSTVIIHDILREFFLARAPF